MINFKWRHFEKGIILMAVRWYLAYALSYRNIEELMLERDVLLKINQYFQFYKIYCHPSFSLSSACPKMPIIICA